MKRLLTALVLIPLITYVVIWSPLEVFVVVLTAVALLCYIEYDSIVGAHRIQKPGLLGMMAGLIVLLAPGGGIPLVAGVALVGMAWALRALDLRGELARSGAMVLGVAYVFGSWRCCLELRAISSYWLFLAISLNWVGDSAAMFAGRTFGRNKLAPTISPGKTWEGSIASAVASVLFGMIFSHFVLPGTSLWLVALVTLFANIAGQIGDLAESALKRGAGMKDSGTMLPGHGGWLDRVDSTMFAVPTAYGLLSVARSLNLSV